MAKNIWVFCEQRDGEIQSVAFELLGVARELAAKTGEKVGALLLGSGVEKKAKDLVAFGADEVYVVDDKNLGYYVTEPYAQAVYSLVKEYEPNVLLFGATSIGRDLAPRLSARLKTGLTADCTNNSLEVLKMIIGTHWDRLTVHVVGNTVIKDVTYNINVVTS